LIYAFIKSSGGGINFVYVPRVEFWSSNPHVPINIYGTGKTGLSILLVTHYPALREGGPYFVK
jgi:hypothetical protein